MAESETESGLSKVARTVGSVLGSVASKTAGVVKTITPDAPEAAPTANKSHSHGHTGSDLEQRALARKKLKRAKHKRQLGRKTAG